MKPSPYSVLGAEKASESFKLFVIGCCCFYIGCAIATYLSGNGSDGN
jgi:hypothetical protein